MRLYGVRFIQRIWTYCVPGGRAIGNRGTEKIVLSTITLPRSSALEPSVSISLIYSTLWCAD